MVIKKNDGEPKEKKPINYRVFFIIGISYIPLGIATKNHLFMIAGVIFMIAGLVNHKKWKDYKKDKEPKWSELSAKQKKVRIIVISLLGLMVLAGVATLFLAKSC